MVKYLFNPNTKALINVLNILLKFNDQKGQLISAY